MKTPISRDAATIRDVLLELPIKRLGDPLQALSRLQDAAASAPTPLRQRDELQKGEPAMTSKHTYTLEAGRCIMRDGKSFVGITRIIGADHVSPVDADDFARLCANAPDVLRQRDKLRAALQRIDSINGSTGGAESMVAEFKHIASAALANCEKEKQK